MCGRYSLYTDQELAELTEIVREVERRHGEQVKLGEVFPSTKAPIITGPAGRQPSAQLAAWGFPSTYSKGLVINARSETAAEKRMFSKHLAEHRCLVPCTGFFEWGPFAGQEKQKVLFHLPGEPLFYLAGIFRESEGVEQYVILTTAANASVANIHHRMPVIVPHQQVSMWIGPIFEQAANFLSSQQPELTAVAV